MLAWVCAHVCVQPADEQGLAGVSAMPQPTAASLKRCSPLCTPCGSRPASPLPPINPSHAALVSPYARNLPRTPEITNVYMTSGVDVPVDTKDWGVLGADQDIVHMGGEQYRF